MQVGLGLFQSAAILCEAKKEVRILTKTLKDRQEAKAWQREHDQAAPRVGDLAPDFTLRDANGENPVRLSDFRGKKPVALIFGSFT